MLTIYIKSNGRLAKADLAPGEPIPPEAVWIDLNVPTREEELLVEHTLGIDAPTREEMQEIEISNRLYAENDAIYMTATVMTRSASELPVGTPVTFILARDALVTLRYAEPTALANFAVRAARERSGISTGPAVLIGILEAVVNRLADVLELVGSDIDAISREVFTANARRTRSNDFHDVLGQLGRKGDMASKARETLISFVRVTHFLLEMVDVGHLQCEADARNRLGTVDKDVASLLDHTNYLSGKISFLLEATLGLINIEQNAIIKLFSVVSVALMPPTLIASIYGMNFDFMPELHWRFGYPMALLLMVTSAVIPFVYFKRKGWF